MESLTLTERAKSIRAVVLDGDGVLFTGRGFIHPQDGEFMKERSYADGQGISLLRAAGVRVAFASAEATGFVEAIGKRMNSLPSVASGAWPPVGVFTGVLGREKAAAVEQWLGEAGIPWGACAAMGDDISDFELLGRVGLAAAPAQAEAIIQKIAHFVAPRRGGDGAIRDLVNLILEAKGVEPVPRALR